MDGQRFDRLTRVLAEGRSRRSVVKGVLAGVAGVAVGKAPAALATCTAIGGSCSSHFECCNRFCDGGSCAECSVDTDCVPEGTGTCMGAYCYIGTCHDTLDSSLCSDCEFCNDSTYNCESDCDNGYVCCDDQCVEGTSCCTPKTCADYSNQCGEALDDGCGSTISCGCDTGDSCCDGSCCKEGQCSGNGWCCADDREACKTECCGPCEICYDGACIAGKTGETCWGEESPYPQGECCAGKCQTTAGDCCDDGSNEQWCSPDQCSGNGWCCADDREPCATGCCDACQTCSGDVCVADTSATECYYDAGGGNWTLGKCCAGTCIPLSSCCTEEDCPDKGCNLGSCVLGTCTYTPNDSQCGPCGGCSVDGDGKGTCGVTCNKAHCCPVAGTDDYLCADCCEDSDCPWVGECGAPVCFTEFGNICGAHFSSSHCDDCETCGEGGICESNCEKDQYCCGLVCQDDPCEPECESDKDCEKDQHCCEGWCQADPCDVICKSDWDCEKDTCCCKHGSCSPDCCHHEHHHCHGDGDCKDGACCCDDGHCSSDCCPEKPKPEVTLPNTGSGAGEDGSSLLTGAVLLGGAAALLGGKVLRKPNPAASIGEE